MIHLYYYILVEVLILTLVQWSHNSECIKFRYGSIVTITDCNGCTSTWSGFVANVVNGCTDPNVSNFDPLVTLMMVLVHTLVVLIL